MIMNYRLSLLATFLGYIAVIVCSIAIRVSAEDSVSLKDYIELYEIEAKLPKLKYIKDIRSHNIGQALGSAFYDGQPAFIKCTTNTEYHNMESAIFDHLDSVNLKAIKMTEADRALVVRRIAKFELTPQSPCFVLSTIPSAIDLVDFIGNVPLKKRLNSLSFILPQLLRAVAYLHRAGVGHGDLKLDNFLIGPGNSPRVLLIDFDRSVIYNKEPYGIPYGGTPGYIPPEYYNNNPDLSKPPIVNLQLYDSWQLGCIFYVFLTNKLPYGFESTSKGSLSPLNPAVHFAAMEKLLKTKKHTYPPVKYPFTDLPLVEKMRLYVLEMSMKRLMTIDVRQRYTPERLLDSNLFNLQKAAMRQ